MILCVVMNTDSVYLSDKNPPYIKVKIERIIQIISFLL